MGDPYSIIRDFDAYMGTTAVRCFLCRRIEDGGGVNVTIEGAVRWVCSYCEDRYADEIRIPLDMTEDEGDE